MRYSLPSFDINAASLLIVILFRIAITSKTGLAIVSPFSIDMIFMTSVIINPQASLLFHPVRVSAMRFIFEIFPLTSVAITASPIESRVTL